MPRDERARRTIDGILEVGVTIPGVCEYQCCSDGCGITDESCRWQEHYCNGDKTKEEVDNAESGKKIVSEGNREFS